MNLIANAHALGNAKVFRIISYALVFLMLLCVILAASGLVHNAIPSWPADIMAGVMLLVVVDRIYTYPRFKTLALFSPEWAVTFGTQWIVFVIFIRLLLSYAKGLEAFVSDMRLFTHGYIEDFLSPEFIVTMFLAGLAWYIPARFLELLDEIGLDQAIALREGTLLVQKEEAPAHQRLVSLIFNLGIILVLLTALASINLQAAFTNPAGSAILDPSRFSAGEAGVLLYFLFGLGLLAQSRLMALQTRWNIQRIPVSSDNLGRKWGLYSLAFLFLLVLIVSLLPTGDSLGIFSLLGTLFGFLIGILLFLGQLIIMLVSVLISLPFLLLGRRPLFTNVLTSPFSVPPPPVETIAPSPASAAWILIRSILLWGGLILIVVFSLAQFIRQHENVLTAIRRAPVLNWLILIWEWLRRNADRTRTGLARVLADGWQSIAARLERRRALAPAGWISLRSLDPRRRVYFFYLTMIRHGDKQGLKRAPSQTPSEYAATLERNLPSAGEDIDAITGAFMEARYSRHEVNSGVADTVKAIWERIRRALQEKLDREQSAKK